MRSIAFQDFHYSNFQGPKMIEAMRYFILVFVCLNSLHLMGQITLIKKNESCAGRKDGSIKVEVQGIISQPIYTWTFNGQPYTGGEQITGLAPGDYAVTVSTEHGCMATKAAKVWPG